MNASLNLSADDLLGIVAAALGQHSYNVTGVRLFDAEDNQVQISHVIIDHDVPPIRIRQIPDKDKEVEEMRQLLHPDIKAHARIFANKDNKHLPAGGDGGGVAVS